MCVLFMRWPSENVTVYSIAECVVADVEEAYVPEMVDEESL